MSSESRPRSQVRRRSPRFSSDRRRYLPELVDVQLVLICDHSENTLDDSACSSLGLPPGVRRNRSDRLVSPAHRPKLSRLNRLVPARYNPGMMTSATLLLKFPDQRADAGQDVTIARHYRPCAGPGTPAMLLRNRIKNSLTEDLRRAELPPQLLSGLG
jgi:hypothetical protein